MQPRSWIGWTKIAAHQGADIYVNEEGLFGAAPGDGKELVTAASLGKLKEKLDDNLRSDSSERGAQFSLTLISVDWHKKISSLPGVRFRRTNAANKTIIVGHGPKEIHLGDGEGYFVVDGDPLIEDILKAAELHRAAVAETKRTHDALDAQLSKAARFRFDWGRGTKTAAALAEKTFFDKIEQRLAQRAKAGAK